MDVQAVLFDMDGVLINSEPIYETLQRDFFQRHHIHAPLSLLRRFIGASHGYWEALAEVNPQVDMEEIKLKSREEEAGWNIHYPDLLMDGVLPLLQALQKQGMKLAVASSSPRKQMEQVLQACQIMDYFDILYSGCDTKKGKPDPEIFIQSATMLEVEPKHCVVLEDSYNGVLAAHRARMKVIAIRHDEYDMDLSLADYVISSYDEVYPFLFDDHQK